MRSNGGEVDRGEEEGRTGNFNSVYKLKMCCGFVSVEGLFLVVFFFFFHRSVYIYVICMHSTYMNVYLHAD